MRTKPKIYLFPLLILALVAAGLAWPTDLTRPKIKLTGMFSDMRYSGGDVLGQEIFIVYSKPGYFVVLQGSEGEPAKPTIVPATFKGSEVTFFVPADVDSRGEFRGVVSQEGLVGTFSGNGQSIHLNRKNSYWQ